MSDKKIFKGGLIITGSVTASGGFFGDGSGLTNVLSTWGGIFSGSAQITGSLSITGSLISDEISGSFTGSYKATEDLNLNNYNIINGGNLSGEKLTIYSANTTSSLFTIEDVGSYVRIETQGTPVNKGYYEINKTTGEHNLFGDVSTTGDLEISGSFKGVENVSFSLNGTTVPFPSISYKTATGFYFFPHSGSQPFSLLANNLTSVRALTVPNKSGTLALTSDITGLFVDLSSTQNSIGGAKTFTTDLTVLGNIVIDDPTFNTDRGGQLLIYRSREGSSSGSGDVSFGSPDLGGFRFDSDHALRVIFSGGTPRNVRLIPDTSSSIQSVELRIPSQSGTIATTSDLSGYVSETTGSFTPTFSAPTIGGISVSASITPTGTWVKTGRLVHISMIFSLSGSGDPGNVANPTITLPFIAGFSTGTRAILSARLTNVLAFTPTYHLPQFSIDNGSTSGTLILTNLADMSSAQWKNIGSHDVRVTISGTYQTQT